MTAAAHHQEAARCTRCLYTLAGLGNLGRCPECGEHFEIIEPPEETIANRKTRLAADLALRRLNGPPTLLQRLTPWARPAALVLFVVGVAGTLMWIGWETIQAINYKLGWSSDHYRPPRPSTTGSLAAVSTIGDVLLVALRCIPYALLLLAIVLAVAGLSFRRVPLAPGTTLTGSEARGLGAFGLGAAILIAGILYITAFSA